MNGVALKMLIGDPTKYLGLVFGVAFSTLLITQQGGLFTGLMLRTASVIDDVREADIWVMDPAARYIDTVRPMRDTELARVRGVKGVAWATPLYKSTAALKTLDGLIETGMVIGVDDETLIGAPRRWVLGNAANLRRPDAVAIDEAGYRRLWPDGPLELGRELELNDRRAVVVAISRASPAFSANVIFHTRYRQAIGYVPQGRNQLSFLLVRAVSNQPAAEVAQRIARQTGLQALTAADFRWKTILYYLVNTGIPINFGVVIVLGVIVGVAIVGLTFNMFVAENIRQYGALKAIGLGDARLVAMVLLQAAVVGLVGYGIGLGLAAAFFELATRGGENELRGMFLPWWIAAGVASMTVVIMLAATAASLRRVLVLDPAIVFRG